MSDSPECLGHENIFYIIFPRFDLPTLTTFHRRLFVLIIYFYYLFIFHISVFYQLFAEVN